MIKLLLSLQFGPEFQSGDGEGIDMKLSNKVYNRLKMHSLSETKRSQRLHEKKEFSTSVSFHLSWPIIESPNLLYIICSICVQIVDKENTC